MRLGFYAGTAAFALAAIYFGWRVFQSHFDPLLPFKLDETGRVESVVHARYTKILGVKPGLRLARVNGIEIRSRADFGPALGKSAALGAVFEFAPEVPGAPPLLVVWQTTGRPIRLEADANLAVVAGLPAALGNETLEIKSLNAEPVASAEDYRSKLALATGNTLAYALAPPGSPAAGPFAAGVTYAARLNDRRIPWVLYGVGVAFGAMGVVAFRLKPLAAMSWGFFLQALASGLFLMFRAIPYALRLYPERIGMHVLMLVMPLPTLYFLGTFTPLRLVLARMRPALFALAGAMALVFAANWVFFPVSARAGELGRPLFIAWLLVMILLPLVSLPMDMILKARGIAVPAPDRQRGIVIRFATLAAFLPLAAYAIFRTATGRGADVRFWFEFPVLLFPLIVAYTIIRYNLLQLDEFMREATIFSSLLALLAVAYTAVVMGAVPLVERMFPGGGSAATMTFVGAVVVVAGPMHSRVRRWLERRFKRHESDIETVVSTVEFAGRALVQPQTYFESLARRVSRAVGINDISILMRHPATEGWWLAARTESAALGPDLAVLRPLLELAADLRQEIHRETLMDDMRYRGVKSGAIAGLNELRASFLFPLIVGSELWGVLAVGEKSSLRNFTANELQSLRRLARECSTALYGFNLRLAGAGDAARGAPRIVDRYPEVPERIGRFEILRLVGEGGMSLVYLGRSGAEQAAIKLANRRVQSDPELMRRFHREAQAMRRLEHVNIARILDVGNEGPEPFLVVEYFPDGSLDDLLARRGPFDEAEAERVIAETCRGLDAALAKGVIHRDIKPRNIFMDIDGTVKIGDFGLAKVEDETTITTHFQMRGTPAYLSPEACEQIAIDWRSDQYALGVTFFEILTGKRPFRGSTIAGIVHQHLYSPPPDPRGVRPDVSAESARTIMKMMAKRPEDRFGSYEEIVEAFKATLV